MKRMVSIVMLFLLVFQVAGYYAAFRLIQCGIRQENWRGIESGLHQGDLVEWRLPADRQTARNLGFEIEHNREIIYKGHYYDIVSARSDGTDIVYQCIADIKESRLVHGMKRGGDHPKPEFAGSFQVLLHLVFATYIPEQQFIMSPDREISDMDPSRYLFTISTWKPDRIAPPPQLMV